MKKNILILLIASSLVSCQNYSDNSTQKSEDNSISNHSTAPDKFIGNWGHGSFQTLKLVISKNDKSGGERNSYYVELVSIDDGRVAAKDVYYLVDENTIKGDDGGSLSYMQKPSGRVYLMDGDNHEYFRESQQ